MAGETVRGMGDNEVEETLWSLPSGRQGSSTWGEEGGHTHTHTHTLTHSLSHTHSLFLSFTSLSISLSLSLTHTHTHAIHRSTQPEVALWLSG